MKRNAAAIILAKFILPLIILLFLQPSLQGQDVYWQQEVHYKIDVSLNELNHTLKGEESLEYVNHSPDTLHFIWFHLWPNAYKDNTTAFSRQLAKLKSRSGKLNSMEENGYIDSLHFTVNGRAASVETQAGNIDILKVLLSNDLLPGQHITIATPFFVKMPSYTSRSGYADGMFMITQWYPKPAVYDRKGWHPMPYLDMGEFYSEFGSFSVNIDVPSSYVVAATGSLLTNDELLNYKTVGAENYKLFNQQPNSKVKARKYIAPDGASRKMLQYYGKDIHDFAWFADKNFIIQYDTVLLPSGKSTNVFSFKQPGGNSEWNNSIRYIKDALRSYSKWIGEYPYPVANALEGPANASSGGMEYPMITMITSPGADQENLDAVITHEVGHNWFYGILGTNERDHAWMDEGIDTYYQFRYEAEKYRSNSILGEAIPSALKQKPPDEFLRSLYSAFAQMPMATPIDTPSPDFFSDDDYSFTVYLKASVWMYLLESFLGRGSFDKGMQSFYKQWQFKHPYPEDLKRSLEKFSGKDLSEIFNLLEKRGSLN